MVPVRTATVRSSASRTSTVTKDWVRPDFSTVAFNVSGASSTASVARVIETSVGEHTRHKAEPSRLV